MDIDSILQEIGEMLVKKNADYGDSNLLRHGQTGIIIRCSDKLARLEQIGAGVGAVNESAEREWLDIAGYAIQAVRLLREGRLT